MDQQYVQRANDWIKWFNEHGSRIRTQPIPTQVEFLTKAMLGAYELISGLSQQTLNVEYRRKVENRIILPTGVRF